MQEVLTMIANFGFPVVAAAYLLVRIEGKLEKLALAFRLAPEFEGERDPVDLGEGHREYVICCRLRSLESGQVVASGLGSCNTLESRVRSRFTPDPASPEKGAALPDAYNLILKQAKKRPWWMLYLLPRLPATSLPRTWKPCLPPRRAPPRRRSPLRAAGFSYPLPSRLPGRPGDRTVPR